MGVTQDGWLDWAERYPGPGDKQYTEPNAAIGYIPHSAVGYYQGWLGRLVSQDKLANGQYSVYAAASVHGFVHYDGRVTQHYPLNVSCWANGSRYSNTHFVAFETEGGYDPVDEPLTQAQVDSHLRIIRDWAGWRGIVNFTRPKGGNDASANLWEHDEMTRFGSAPTACPSHRIPWDYFLTQLNQVPQVPMREEFVHEGNFWVLYNGGVAVRRWGSTDGLYPGRESKLFGNKYLWLRLGAGNVAYWDEVEGD